MLIGNINHREELHNLINELGLKIGLEVGVQEGLYSKYLLKNTNLYLYLVDGWKQLPDYNDIANVPDLEQEKVYQKCLDNLKPYNDRYLILRYLSPDISSSFEDGFFDFIYLDAGHSYKAMTADLNAWYPKLKSGGLMSGHDFVEGENLCGSEFGVQSAIYNFIKDKNIELFVTKEAWPTWYWRKE